MSRTIRHLTLVVGAALLVAPTLATAQGGRGPDRPQRPGPMAERGPQGPRGSGVTALLDARRELELTPRQVAQLDSLERVQFTERRQFAERMRPVRDSLVQRGRADPAARDSLRKVAEARMAANRPQLEQRRQRDSSLDAAAERVLNESQRAKVRVMQAERRGFERGLRAGQGRDGRNGPPRGGVRGGAQGGRGAFRGPQEGQAGPPGMRGPQGPAGQGGRGGMPPRRPPVDSEDR